MNLQTLLITVFIVGISAFVTRSLLGAHESMSITSLNTRARYVRVSRDRPQLEVAEIQVYDQSNMNVAALYGTASQSTTHTNSSGTDFGPNVVIDGNTSGLSQRGEVATTKPSDTLPWIELDLGSEFNVKKLVIHMRDTENKADYKNTRIELLRFNRTVLWSQEVSVWQRMYTFAVHLGK